MPDLLFVAQFDTEIAPSFIDHECAKTNMYILYSILDEKSQTAHLNKIQTTYTSKKVLSVYFIILNNIKGTDTEFIRVQVPCKN